MLKNFRGFFQFIISERFVACAFLTEAKVLRFRWMQKSLPAFFGSIFAEKIRCIFPSKLSGNAAYISIEPKWRH